MKFALYSDLHLDLLLRNPPPALPPLNVDLVILAGDIGRHTHGLDWAGDVFPDWPGSPKIVYVAGNHEYYDAHLGLLTQLRKPAWKQWGIHFLENEAVEVSGVRILGCTFWSGFDLYGADKVAGAMAVARRSINDYETIRTRGGKRLEPADTLRLHRKAVAWLDAELTKPFNGKTVVVTHFAPHRRCVPEKFQGSDLSPYFVTDLSWLMEKHRIDVWCFGHTHTNCDFVAENGCRVVSNQRGYASEVAAGDTGFRPELVVEV
jgi:predicted phosphodiesterase